MLALIKLPLFWETCLQLGTSCQFMPYTHFPQHCTPVKITRQRDILLPSLPKAFCRTGTWLLRGWQISQLSCQHSSEIKPPRMLTQGETVLYRWKLCSSKKFLAPFIILNKRLWEFLLEWVGMRIVLRQKKDFPSLLSVPPTHHTTSSYKVGLLIPSLHCFACPATSPAQRTGQTLEESALYTAGTQHVKELFAWKWLRVHTVPKVSSCAEEERMGQTTLPQHKESQKQKQYIHQSDLTAHIMMEPRTFLYA